MSPASPTPLLDAVRRSCKAQGIEIPLFDASADAVEQHLAKLADHGLSPEQMAHTVALDGICALVSKSA